MKSFSFNCNGGFVVVALGAIVVGGILGGIFLYKMPAESIERILIHAIDSAKEHATTEKLEA